MKPTETQTITREEIDEVIDFAIAHHIYEEEDREEMRWIISDHVEYNTLMIIRSDKTDKIIAFCRWNILPTGRDAHIMDLIIHPKYRKKSLAHRMLRKGLNMYPQVDYLVFQRQEKGKPFKKVPVRWLLKRRF